MNGNQPAVRRYQVLAQREYLERAANELKKSPLFERFSRRLLFDLVERNGLTLLRSHPGESTGLDESVGNGPNFFDQRVFLAIVVLEGTAIAIEQSPDPGPLPPDAGIELTPQVYLRGDDELTDIVPGRLRITTRDSATVVAIDVQTLKLCPTAAWSLNFEARSELIQDLPALKNAQRPEIIWIGAAPETNIPSEAAMHIVGGAMVRDALKVPLVLCLLGAQTTRLIWRGGRFESLDHPLHPDNTFVLLDNQVNPIQPSDPKPIQHVQFLACNPQDPMHWPPGFDTVRADRVVHLTTALPTVLADDARGLLWNSLLSRGESIYSSYIASVLVDPEGKSPRLGDLCGGEFETLTLSCGPDEPATRPYRDACTLRADSAELARAWENWTRRDPLLSPPFIEFVDSTGVMSADTSARWARAVTNRRVGIAISGGGASAYRAGPLLCRIKHANIPIDVFAALSGGALLGAFYCGMEPGGFEFFERLAPFIQATMPGVVVSTWPFEITVDALLRWTRVEDLETRFAAIAVALPETTPPETRVVIKGTLGEAARVSGCLPPSFAPTVKNCTRYTDGGAGCLVPACAAYACGADVVLACNVIPGPARGNPFSALGPGGALLRWMPWIGRLIDNYTWYAYLMCQSSKAFGGYAEVFVDFDPQDLPLVETVLFATAQGIIDDANAGDNGRKLDCKVAKLKKEWLKLQPPAPPPLPPPRPAHPRSLARPLRPRRAGRRKRAKPRE